MFSQQTQKTKMSQSQHIVIPAYTNILKNSPILSSIKQEGLAVASTARDDPSTLPGNDPFPHAHSTATAMRGKLGSELAIMRQCTSVTDRRTDRQTLTS